MNNDDMIKNGVHALILIGLVFVLLFQPEGFDSLRGFGPWKPNRLWKGKP